MLGFLARKKVDAACLTEEQARKIIEAEIGRRGWSEYPDRHYRIGHREGRDLWCYSGVDLQNVGSMMSVEIDAVTGALVHAAMAPR